MAHHQGMSLVAYANVLNNGAMRSRFHAEPIVQATELLLQERTPRDVLVARPRAEEVSAAAQVRELVPPMVRRFTTPHDATPRTQLLSNGRYAVMLTAAGSGYSRWRGIAITRWREDPTRDCWGMYFYLARPAKRKRLVRRIPATRRRAGRLRSGLFRRPCGDYPPRPFDDHEPRGGRIFRRRCGNAPRLH